MKKMHILLLGALPILLLLVTCAQDTPTSVSPSAVQTDITLAKNSNIDAFDMVDAFSGSGASGNGFVKVRNGQMNLTLHVRDLLANHPYEVHVIVGPEGKRELDLENLSAVFIFPVTSDEDGELRFREEFDLGLDPGQYRLDYLVLHDLAAHDHDQDTFPTFLVLACEPASFFTLTDDD